MLLGAKYKAGHILGAAICVAAIVLLIVTDEEFSRSSGPSTAAFGDALVLFGASLYAVSNVLQEKLLGKPSILANDSAFPPRVPVSGIP